MMGMMLGALLAFSTALFFWSLVPAHETVMIPRVLTSLPMVLDISESQGGGGGRQSGGCGCGQDSGSLSDSKRKGAMDGHGSPSLQDAHVSSLHSLDTPLPPLDMRQLLLHKTTPQEEQTASGGGAAKLKEARRYGTLIQQPVTRGVTQGRGGLGGGRAIWTIQSLKEEKKVRDALVVAVIINGTQLKWAESVSRTWGNDASHLVFYVKGHSNISIPQATGIGRQAVPLHTSGSMHTRLALLQHLGEHYLDSHQWFVVVTEDTYVHVDQLEAVMGRLDPNLPLILGPPPHCMAHSHSGGSVVLSQALLALLTPRLNTCLSRTTQGADGHGSAEMEACVAEDMNIDCSLSSSVSLTLYWEICLDRVASLADHTRSRQSCQVFCSEIWI